MTITPDVSSFSLSQAEPVPSELFEFSLAPYKTHAPQNTVYIREVAIENVIHDRDFGCLEADVRITFHLHWSQPPISVMQHSMVGVDSEESADSRRVEMVRTAIVLALMKSESLWNELSNAA